MSEPRATVCTDERELYALWEERAVTGARFVTLDARDVIVLSRGVRNCGPGPDYHNAVLIIAGRLTTGAVEMHRREHDWFLHGHDRDEAYRSVILHVLGDASESRSLAIPSMLAESLARATQQDRPRPAGSGISRELLVDAAWSRLLRRATEILRAETTSAAAPMRSAFIVRLFDCLGYSVNRRPMRLLAERIVGVGLLGDDGAPGRGGLRGGAGFDEVAAYLFGLAGCDPRTVRALGAGFMSDSRLDRILESRPARIEGIRWTHATRPANAPERRLWAAARLIVEIERGRRLERLLDGIAGGVTWHKLERELVVRLGSESFIGVARAGEIVMNALLPVGLAAGILLGSTQLIEGACRLYRRAPAQQSNRTIRHIERRFLDGRTLTGGFWQQGAIEHFQRYLMPDRSALTFLADTSPRYRSRRA